MSYVNSTIMPWCVVNGCRNNLKGTKQVDKNVSYHIIPKNPQRRSAWINILNQSSKFNADSPSSYVCSEHFVSDDYECYSLKEKLLNIKVKKQLKKTAIPSINLPKSQEEEILNTPISLLDSQVTNETNNTCNKSAFPEKVLKSNAVSTSNFELGIIEVKSIKDIKDIERKKLVDKMIADYDEQKKNESPLTGIINKYPNFFSTKINPDAKLGDKLKYLKAIDNLETGSPPKKQKKSKSTKSNVQSFEQPIFNNSTPNSDQFIQVSAVKGGLMLYALPLVTNELKNTYPRQHGSDKEDETEEIIIVTKDEALDGAKHANLPSPEEQHKENNTEVVIVTNLKETEDTSRHIDSLSKESSTQVCNSYNKCFEQNTFDNKGSQFTPLYTAKVSLSEDKGCQVSVPCKGCQDRSLKINRLLREKSNSNQICIWKDSDDMNTLKRMNGVLSLLLMKYVGVKNELYGKKSSIGVNLVQESIETVNRGWSKQNTSEALSEVLSINAYDEFARTFNI